MGHSIRAVIAKGDLVAQLAARWDRACIVPLPLEFDLIPVTDALFDNVNELVKLSKADPFPEFTFLSAGLHDVLVRESAHGVVAYVETEYFGGVGYQAAVAWQREIVVAGPFGPGPDWADSGSGGEGAINKILAALGVWTKDGKDEFDMLGLGQFRDTERVAEKYSE